MPMTVDSLLAHKGRAIWSVRPETSVLEAIRLMSDKSIGAVLVLRGAELVGILSERDYTRRVVLEGRSSKDTPAEQIMTRGVISVTGDRTVDDCMALMTEKHIRHLPVLGEGHRVVGVVSIGDVVRALLEEKGAHIGQLERYIMGV